MPWTKQFLTYWEHMVSLIAQQQSEVGSVVYKFQTCMNRLI